MKTFQWEPSCSTRIEEQRDGRTDRHDEANSRVTNVKFKSLCVRFYISILVFSNLYIEMVTVRFHSLPHCGTKDRSQLLLNAYLSVPHSFEAFNLYADAISLSQL